MTSIPSNHGSRKLVSQDQHASILKDKEPNRFTVYFNPGRSQEQTEMHLVQGVTTTTKLHAGKKSSEQNEKFSEALAQDLFVEFIPNIKRLLKILAQEENYSLDQFNKERELYDKIQGDVRITIKIKPEAKNLFSISLVTTELKDGPKMQRKAQIRICPLSKTGEIEELETGFDDRVLFHMRNAVEENKDSHVDPIFVIDLSPQ